MNQLFDIFGNVIGYDNHTRHPKCEGTYDEHTGDYDCDYPTTLTCDECIYGVGRKNPEAKCNRSK